MSGRHLERELEGLGLHLAVVTIPGGLEPTVGVLAEDMVGHVGDRVERLPPGTLGELSTGLSVEDVESQLGVDARLGLGVVTVRRLREDALDRKSTRLNSSHT